MGANPKIRYWHSESELLYPKTIGELEANEEKDNKLMYRYAPGEIDISKYKVDCYSYEIWNYVDYESPESQLLFFQFDWDNSDDYFGYWLASPCVNADFRDSYAKFGLRSILESYVEYDILVDSKGEEYNPIRFSSPGSYSKIQHPDRE